LSCYSHGRRGPIILIYMHVPSAVRLTVAREIKCFGLKHVTATRRVRPARYLDANLSGTDSEHVRAVRACTSIWEPVRCLLTGKSRKNEGEGNTLGFPRWIIAAVPHERCRRVLRRSRKYYANDPSREPLDFPRLQSRETSVAFFHSERSILGTRNRAVIVAIISRVPGNSFNRSSSSCLSSRSRCHIEGRFRESDASQDCA